MKLIPLMLTLILITACGGSAAPPTRPETIPVQTAVPTPEPLRSYSVIGYFPDYRELNPRWAQSLTDIVYFSAEPRADGALDTSRLTEENWRLLQQMKTEQAIRVYLSIGGWERDGGFVKMTADPNTRKIFIANLLDFLLAHNLDGADFDWEFPKDEDEFADYITLLAETRAVLSAHGFLVSVALPAEPGFPLGEFAVVDRVHIMSYDRGGKHATFEQAVSDLQLFLDAGLPTEKLILGMPFYARSISSPMMY